MKKLLTIIFTLFSVFAWAQSQPRFGTSPNVQYTNYALQPYKYVPVDTYNDTVSITPNSWWTVWDLKQILGDERFQVATTTPPRNGDVLELQMISDSGTYLVTTNSGIDLSNVFPSGTLQFTHMTIHCVYNTTAGKFIATGGTAGAASWKITGNDDIDTSNFLGTVAGDTDAVSIRINGVERGQLRLNGSLKISSGAPVYYPITTAPWCCNPGVGSSVFIGDSVAWGANATAAFDSLRALNNVIVGFKAGHKFKFGFGNTVIGAFAMSLAIGQWGSNTNPFTGAMNVYENNFIGEGSGYACLTCFENTGDGAATLHDCVSCHGNSAFGLSALQALISGTANVAVGVNSLSLLTTGGHNVAVGNTSLGFNLTTGSNNTAVGDECFPNATGSGNTGLGCVVFDQLAGGNQNTGAGFASGNSQTSGSNNAYFGSFSGANMVNQSNWMIFRASDSPTGSQNLDTLKSPIAIKSLNDSSDTRIRLVGNTWLTSQYINVANIPNDSTGLVAGQIYWVDVAGRKQIYMK